MYLFQLLDKMKLCVRGAAGKGGFMQFKKIFVAIAVVLCVVITGIVYIVSSKDTKATVFEENTTTIEVTLPTVVSGEEELIYVYVCGQVNNPGIVTLSKGARIFEAIQGAGGITENGNPDAINQAKPVEDGQMIYIPMIGEEYTMDSQEEEGDKLVNINTASVSELTTLPGIGESRANDIISYRDSNGDFKTIEDIMNVPGIKEAAFNRIKDYIKV